jgi:hypothetical protein
VSTTADIVVHPGTGEVLDQLDQQPPETLAEALDVIYARQEELKRWEAAIAGELRARLRLRQTKHAQFGEWEVEAAITRSAEWDVAGLETVLEELVHEGVVRAGDVADVVTHPAVVSKSRAGRLASGLTGSAHDRVAALRTWKEQPARKLTVARSVDLLDAAPSPAAQTTPLDDASGSPADTVASPAESRARVPPPLSPAGPATTSPLDPKELFA